MTEPLQRLTAALADRYRIERELGQGGMATVYLAEDLKHDRRVALKVLKPELAAVLGAERFVVEIKTTASLQHPHILPLFDSGTADGFLYYVMPFIEGETLRTRLNRETQLGIDEAVKIAIEVADALDYAHRRGVIHRDIKPENILLHDGRPMVADFGIALAVSAAAGGRMTETGLSLGTPHYMSPEQATAEKEVTGRSDVYSLGSVLYEMLTGEAPHMGNSAQQIIMKIIAEPVPPVTALRKSVPPNVAAAVGKALEKLPADRFTTAGAFAGALRDPTFSHATAVVAGTARSTAARRDRLPWIVAAAAVLLAVAAWVWGPAGSGTNRPEASFVAVSLAAPQASLATIFDRFAVSPSGDAIVFNSVDSATGGSIEGDISRGVARGSRLFVRRLGQLEAVPLPGAGGEYLHSPTFSPDGRWVAFGTNDNRVMKAPLDGQSPPSEVVTAAGIFGMLSWGPDDRIRFPLGGNRVLVSVPSSGGVADSIAFQGDTTVWRGAGLGGDRLLLSIFAGSEERIVVRESDGRTRELLSGRDGRVTPTGHLLFSRRAGTGWSLAAATFDAAKATVTSPAVVLVETIPVAFATPGAVTRAGDLFYLKGTPRTDRRIVVLERSGRESATPFGPGPWVSVSASPQGSRVVANLWNGAQRTIWTADLSTGAVAQLTFEDDRFGPIWSPDGRRIAYRYRPDFASTGTAATDQWWVAADGSGAAEPLPQHQGDAELGGFSPDGATLYYAEGSPSDGRLGIWAADLTAPERPRRPLILTPATEDSPTPSPDGQWLAFATDVSGRFEARIGRLPNLANPVQVSTGGGRPLGWRQDGRRFFYSDGSVVWEVEVGPGGPIPQSARRAFTLPPDTKAVTITADGERLVLVRGGDMYSDLAVIQGALKR